MRVAMGVRDGGCTAEHCETPPGLCQPTTTPRGPMVATPTSTPDACCAPTTIAASTTLVISPPAYPTGKSASTGGSDPSDRARRAAV